MTVNNLPPRGSQAAFQLLFFLRFIQLGSTVITGFIACYFIWWHNVINDDVPEGLKIILFASILTFLESYLASSLSLYNQSARLNYSRLLLTIFPCAIVQSLGYCSLRQVPFVRTWCEGNNFVSVYDNVEKANCALTCDIIVSGAIAWVFTGLITLFASIGCGIEKGCGRVKLGECFSRYINDVADVAGDVADEKKGSL